MRRHHTENNFRPPSPQYVLPPPLFHFAYLSPLEIPRLPSNDPTSETVFGGSPKLVSNKAPSQGLLFGTFCSEENKEHPKTQHTRKRRQWTVSRTCVSGCVAFSGVLCSPLRGHQNTTENTVRPKIADSRNGRLPALSGVLRFRVCFGACQFVRVGFWQNRFFADFYFWAAGSFLGFCRRIFLSSFFVGRVRIEKSSRKIPVQILQNYTKSLTHFCRGGGPKFPPPPYQGCRNGRFGKRCFFPLPKTRGFGENRRKFGYCIRPIKTRDVAPRKSTKSTKNDENGRCHPGKMTACRNHRFDNPPTLALPSMNQGGLPDKEKRGYNTSGRAVPDISAQATNFPVVAGLPIPMPVAGTSCASPTAAAIFSLLNDLRLQKAKKRRALKSTNPRSRDLPSTPKCLPYKKILRGNNFVKFTKNIFQR